MIQYAFQETTAHSEHGSHGADSTERFGVSVADEQNQSQTHCWWLISELCKCVCVCVCGRYFGSAPQTTADLETDYISEQRRTKNKETDFILTHRRGITTNDDISQRKGEGEKLFLMKCWILWEISLILKWNIPDISFLSLCIAIGKKKQNNCLSYAVLTWDLKSPISKMFLLNRLFSEIQKRS